MAIDLPIDKANYVGNKRRLAKYIVDKFPEGAKTLFDPMCGCSAVLIEAAKRGLRVTANDLSPTPYWYSKGVFEGARLSEEDIERLKQAKPHEGWLTKEWQGIYPRPSQVRRFLDGLAKAVRDFSGAKGWAAKAILSRILQTMYADSGSGYATRKYESIPAIRGLVDHAAKEINGFIGEVAGKGSVTNENALTARFPRADVIYFDPPFFKRDKGFVRYFDTYKTMNSVLLQKTWKAENLTPDQVPPILEKLAKSGNHIFVSTSSNEMVPYQRELERHKRTVKRYRIEYNQPSGFGSREEVQREHLYAAKALQWGEEPYLDLPREGSPHRYVVQEHFRGQSLHADLRFEAPEKRFLIGWTLATGKAGALARPVTTVEEASRIPGEASRIDWGSGAFEMGERPAEIAAFPKDPHELTWLDFEGLIQGEEGEFPPPGATRNFPGVLRIVDAGFIEYGCQKPGFHEYFLASDRESGGLRGRLTFRRVPADEGVDDAWLLAKPQDQTPYVLSEIAVADGWVPPEGFSALPTFLRNRVPAQYRYWDLSDETDRRQVRDGLVAALKSGDVSLAETEKGAGSWNLSVSAAT